ncbi:MAG TPA: SPOR domain-containing protein [Thermoanaerobaculia bacterium]
MPKQEIVTFRLHRKGVMLVVLGAVFVAVLIFVGGYLLGKWRGMAAVRTPVAVSVPQMPKPQLPAAQPAAPATPADSLTLRVGTFTTEEDAKAAMAQLAALKPAVVSQPTSSGTTLYVLHAGSYRSRGEAAAAAKELEKRGVSAVVVPAQ